MRRWRGPLGLLFVCLGGLVLLSRRLDAVEVRGGSMRPTLEPGDRLLVWRSAGAPRAGDVVVIADPTRAGHELVKRVAEVSPAGVSVAGDNPSASTDSRIFGLVPSGRVRWRVLARYWPLDAIGRVPRPRRRSR